MFESCTGKRRINTFAKNIDSDHFLLLVNFLCIKGEVLITLPLMDLYLFDNLYGMTHHCHALNPNCKSEC